MTVNNTVAQLIERLLAFSLDNLSLNIENITYIRNRLLDLFKLSEPAAAVTDYGRLQEDILDPLLNYAIEKGIISSDLTALFETKVMGEVMPMPSQVIENFDMIAAETGIKAATDYLYGISVNSNYIRMADINKNIGWSYPGSKGDIKITINLSKPEKDPKDVAKQAKAPARKYPLCKLCVDNVGYPGDINYPARHTLRTIPIYLNDERWHLQFSPYSYFSEHLIALSEEHRPMAVDTDAIIRMLDFVDIFPHYFIGSNAALPIVGGSILAHDHYQGGNKVMPMMSVESLKEYYHPRFPSITLSILDWYNSVVRLKGADRSELIKASGYLMDFWSNYTNESVGIISKTDTVHNAVTPVIRREGNTYMIDFVLRNNRTDEKHPYGIYHPTQDLHNIKKESIGIIEVMGLFILPGRLFSESRQIVEYLTGAKKLDFKELTDDKHPLNKHLAMIAQLTNDYGMELSDDAASEAVEGYINKACERILNCTAVFKNNAEGAKAFDEFIISMGYDPI
jgi:UDPglucose--hexose-1-phosphate uridylyltransferase